MGDSLTIGIDEIEGVAAKVEAGESLDDHDQVVFRAVLVLAGQRVADLATDEVEGFALGAEDPLDPGTLELSGLGLGPVAASAPSLFHTCCTGKHFAQVSLGIRKSSA